MEPRLARRLVPLVAALAALTAAPAASAAGNAPAAQPPGAHRQFAVGPQYDSTHVYVEPGTE
ncbi:hypothetical protein ACIQI7_04770 [Kitasatospora sp. NPDC092039]|uniref:hypothetical protein n=1 Tax=Kitasatospora sp. NPDC092039 TaxID=3364086 RepID=UPI003824DB19